MLIFFMADHGMRYGEWFKVVDGSHEHKLPMLFMLGSTNLLNEIPGAFDALEHNTRRLVGKLDLNKTLKHIAYLPYNRGFTKTSPEYRKFTTFTSNAMSLLIDKIPNDRSCGDIEIPPFFCSCAIFYKLELKDKPEGRTSLILRIMLENVIQIINTESYASSNIPPNHICRKITHSDLTDL